MSNSEITCERSLTTTLSVDGESIIVYNYSTKRHIMNGGYASNLSEDILDNENIKVWVHGYIHDPVDYMIGTTRVLANPRGYVRHEDTSVF